MTGKREPNVAQLPPPSLSPGIKKKKKKPVLLKLINNCHALASSLNQGLFELVNLLALFASSELFLTPQHTWDQIKAEVCVSRGMRLWLVCFSCSFPVTVCRPASPDSVCVSAHTAQSCYHRCQFFTRLPPPSATTPLNI